MRPRKTNDTLILKLHGEGLSQVDIAKQLGVSNVAIHKRLKRLLPAVEDRELEKAVPTLVNLTPKQKEFCKLVAEGKSRTQAALESYDCSSRAVAKSLQTELMQNPEIEESIKKLMDYHGLTRSYRVRKLRDHVDHPDPVISLKSLDMSFKLDGYPQPKISLTQETNIQSITVSDETYHRLREGRLEVMMDNMKNNVPVTPKEMADHDTCEEEMVELLRVNMEHYSRKRKPDELLPYFQALDELEKIQIRRAEQIGQSLHIPIDEARAILRERNKQAREKVPVDQN
jgi:hypothetical protein